MGIVTALREFARDYRFGLWSLTGNERDSGASLSIVYAGCEKNKNYIANMAFAENFTEIYLGKKWLWDVRKIRRARHDRGDVLIMEINRRLQAWSGACGYYVPVWIDGETSFDDISRLMKVSERLKSDLRRIRKSGLTYEVTRRKDLFLDFYHRMYLPYTLQAHGDEAVPHSLDTVMSASERSDLLLVKRDGDVIAGEIIVYERDGARFWCSGVVNGNYDHVKAGALAALYYYRYLYLSERGYDKVHLGATRAFLKDGVLQYKKKWGMGVLGDRSSGFYIRLLHATAGARSFLVNNPFLYDSGGELLAAVFTDAADAPGEEWVRKQYQHFYLPGITRLVFHTFEAVPDQVKIPDDLKGRVEFQRAIS
ncbi:MAG: hypothetical protein FD165_671 [Gammaproteobacteria bacterium]|nr:MAG: hypothetical protein FD165_671 [Gammaproteobacteria bacterium]TND06998.1 MAG: hypothetical protein FD120_166 [Gammaproteobacteria bacterium]